MNEATTGSAGGSLLRFLITWDDERVAAAYITNYGKRDMLKQTKGSVPTDNVLEMRARGLTVYARTVSDTDRTIAVQLTPEEQSKLLQEIDGWIADPVQYKENYSDGSATETYFYAAKVLDRLRKAKQKSRR